MTHPLDEGINSMCNGHLRRRPREETGSHIKVILIGGNPKGYSIPFHPATRSGKRLRNLIFKTGILCEIADMTENLNDKPTQREINDLKERYRGYQVVFLGRFVERELKATFPNGVYLPHPASRRRSDLLKLENGLKSLTR